MGYYSCGDVQSATVLTSFVKGELWGRTEKNQNNKSVDHSKDTMTEDVEMGGMYVFGAVDMSLDDITKAEKKKKTMKTKKKKDNSKGAGAGQGKKKTKGRAPAKVKSKTRASKTKGTKGLF